MMGSLRARLLGWVLAPLVMVGIAAAAGAYVFMERRLASAFDADLGEVARAVLPYVHASDGRITLTFTRQEEAVLRADSVDQVWYTVFDADGRAGAGDALLPKPPESQVNIPVFWDDTRSGEKIRAAALRAEVGGNPVVIVAAETTRKRQIASREALLSALAPVALLTFAAVLGLVFGVRRGLGPLDRLREEIQARSHLHLVPVAESGVIDELRPIVHELNEMLGRLDRAQQAQARFVADAAHQLRTPVAGLVAQLELARSVPTESGHHLELARQGAARLARLTRQLLALAAADPLSNPDSADAACDLARVVEVLAGEWLRVAAQRGVEIVFELEPAAVRGNAVLLGELASNLVDNALRHAAASVRVATGRRGGGAMLEVSDDGPGISPTERESIFERFRRLDAQSTEGSGLGLAIVREIAGRHHATVEVGEGYEGKGARFVVAFNAPT
jgi:two-component system sensor histidine kinase TctE